MKTENLGKSKLVIGTLCGFLIGTFIADKIKIDIYIGSGIIAGLIAASIILRNKLQLLAVLSLLGLFVGILYFNFWDARNIAESVSGVEVIDKEVSIISKPEEFNGKQRFIILSEGRKIQVSSEIYPKLSYGDVVYIHAEIKKPSDYLFRKNVSGQIFSPEKIEKKREGGNPVTKNIHNINERFQNNLNRILPEPYAALQEGILLGAKKKYSRFFGKSI